MYPLKTDTVDFRLMIEGTRCVGFECRPVEIIIILEATIEPAEFPVARARLGPMIGQQ